MRSMGNKRKTEKEMKAMYKKERDEEVDNANFFLRGGGGILRRRSLRCGHMAHSRKDAPPSPNMGKYNVHQPPEHSCPTQS